MPLSESCANRLRNQLESLSTVLAGTGEGAIDRRPHPEKWSARENLAHLGRYHEVFLERLRTILNEDEPPLARYRAEEDPEWPRWAALPASEVLQRLPRLRAKVVAEVDRLTDSQLKRVGIHNRLGPMTVEQWLEFFLLHEAHHLLTVMQRVRE